MNGKAPQNPGSGNSVNKSVVLTVVIAAVVFVIVFAASMYYFTFAEDSKPVGADSEIASEIEKIDDSLPEEEQIKQAKVTLERLGDEGKIKKDTLKYDEGQKLFSFKYPDGTLGGVSFMEFSEKYNMNSSSSNEKEDNPELYSVKSSDLTAIILNGFENSRFRRDFYKDVKQEWKSKNVKCAVDTTVTVSELKKLKPFDVIILSMHGTLYDGNPVIVINEKVTKKSYKKNSADLNNEYVGKYYSKKTKEHYYFVMPMFFEHYYKENKTESGLIFSESCMFYGDDSRNPTPDYYMASTVASATNGAVIGFHNSVGAEYSRNVMKHTVDKMLESKTAKDALKSAVSKFGKNDDMEDKADGKYIAYPLIFGNEKAVLSKGEIKDFAETTAPATTTETTTTAPAETELEKQLKNKDLFDVTTRVDTMGEVGRSLRFSDNKKVKYSYYDEVGPDVVNTTYTVEDGAVKVHIDSKEATIDYTVYELDNSAMFGCHCNIVYKDEGDNGSYSYDTFLADDKDSKKADRAQIYKDLGNKFWGSKYIGQFDGWDDEGNINIFVEDMDNPYFTGDVTVTHHSDELYGYAIADKLAAFNYYVNGEELKGQFLIESYNNKTYAYFLESDKTFTRDELHEIK